MSIALSRVQDSDGQEVHFNVTSPHAVGRDFLCAFYLDGSREQVDAEAMQRLRGHGGWITEVSGGARTLQVVVNVSALPATFATWTDLQEEIKRIYYEPQSL